MTAVFQFFSSDWTHGLGWALLHSLWEIALVAVSVALLMAALRRRSANARYLVAIVGLLAMVVLPVATYCVVPPQVDPTIVDPIAPSADMQDVPSPTAVMIPVSDEAWEVEAVASVPSVPVDETPLAIPPKQSQIPETSTPLLARVTQAFSPWMPSLAIVWLLGVSALSVWNLGGWIAAQRLKHLATTPIGGPLADRLAQLARRMKVSRPVQIVQSCLVDVPIVVGWLRPVILVPVGILTGFSPAQLDAILAHELAHIRRHDYLVNLFQTLAETLLFYHPGVWWISRRIRIEREHCCDDAAVGVCGDGVEFAAALVSFEEFRSAPRPALAANEGNTFTRVRRILGIPAPRGRLTKPLAGSLAALAIIGTAACLLWSGQHLNSAQATEDNEPAPFVKARIVQYFDADGQFFTNGRKLTIDDAATIEQLTAFLPDVGKGKKSDRAAGWESSADIRFDRNDKSTLRVVTDFDHWSEGHGDWPVRGDLAGFIEQRFAEALSEARRETAEQAIRLKPVPDEGAKAGQRTTGLDLSELLDLTGQQDDAAQFTKDHRFFERDVKQLVERKRTWALCALLDHENVDAKIHAARGLLQLADPESVPVLLAAAKRNNYPVDGSESATLHSVYRRTLKEASEKITGEQLTPAGLRATTYPKPSEPKVIRSEDDPSFFREAVDFDKVERWLSPPVTVQREINVIGSELPKSLLPTDNSSAEEAAPPEEIRRTPEEPVEQVLMKAYDVGGLEIEAGFVPDANSVMLQEPSFVTFRVTNRSGKPYQFDIGGDNRGSVRHNNFRITAVDAAGRAVRDPYSYANFGGMGQRITLAPGDTHSERLYLGHWLEFKRPGQYTVTCKRTLEKHGRGPRHPPLAVSSHFTMTVTPTDDVAMAAVIARLGAQVRDGEAAKLREATIALADIDDVRVVPHLAASLSRGDSRNDELKQFAAEAAGDDEIDARPAANETTERIQEAAEAGPNVDASLTDNPRQRFLEIERLARLPKAEQAKELKRLYTELAPRYMSPFVTGILSRYPRYILNRADSKHGDGNSERWAQQLEDAAKDLSPEEVADKIDIGLWLNIAAQARVLQVFRRHEKVVTAMIAAGLASRDKAQVERAAATISTLGLHAFTDELLDLLLANGEASEAAHDALLFMRDPDIAKPLLEHVGKDPSSLARCAGLLQGPFYGKAADPLLLGLLGTPDKELRYHAVRAVYECRDPELAPFVAKFARDDETRFRVAAAYMTKNLPDESFKAVRAQLLPLLGDKDESVRFEALRSFGLKRDMAAGPVILETLRREQLGGRFLLHVMHALDALAGETFGYNMHNWGPASQGNRKAIGEFEKWLKNADSRDGFAADLVEEWTGVVTDEEGRPLEGVIVKMCGVEWFDEGRWRRNRRLACYFPRPLASDKAGRFTVQFNEGLFELPFDEKTTRVNFWFDKEGFAPTYLPGMSPRPHEVKVVMKRGIRVSGTVKRPADGKLAPAPAAVVSLQCLSGDLAQQKRFFDDPLSTMKNTTEGCDLPYRKRVSTDVEGRYTFVLSAPPDDKKWCLFCSGQVVMLDMKEGQPTQGPDFIVKDEGSETDGAEDELAPGLNDQEKPSDWGEPVEGIRCRLHAGKSKCDVGQPVPLRAEIRSTEATEGKWLRPTEPSSRCKVEVDGCWYGWVGQVRARPFPPAAVTKQVESLNLQVDWGWRTDAGEMLKLAPGRHTIRVAIAPFREGEAGGQAIHVISNPIEVEVVEPDPKDPDPQAPWGEAVVGVQSRLRAEQVMWKAGEIPTLKADVRNRGERDLAVVQAQQRCEVEVDGRWYQWAGTFSLKSSWFPPGRQYNDIPITLGKNWQSETDKKPISLAPGKHIVRIAVIARAPNPKCDGAPAPIRAVSAPVEIEVLEIDPKDVAPSGEAVEHESETAELKLLRDEDVVISATVSEGQSAADILNALGRPDYVDDDPWFSYRASPEGKYVLLFEEEVSKADAKPDMGSVTLWGVLGPGTDVKEAAFLLPHRLRGKACGDFIALRVRAGPGMKKVATVALGMSGSDVLRLFRPAHDLAAKEGYVIFPSIDDGEFLLVFSARYNDKSDDSASDRLSEVIYRPGGHEKPIYLLPFKKRGQDIPAEHKTLLDDNRSRGNRNKTGAAAQGTTRGEDASELHGRISGVVVDGREAPVAGAAVVLCRQATGVPLAEETFAEAFLDGSQPTDLAYAQADEQGRFSFDQIPAGEYRLVAHPSRQDHRRIRTHRRRLVERPS